MNSDWLKSCYVIKHVEDTGHKKYEVQSNYSRD